MKTRHPLATSMISLLSAGLMLAAGTAGAQTFFYTDAGSGSNAASGLPSDGTLSSIGFDISSWNRSGSYHGDTGGVTARADVPGPGLAYDINIMAPGLFSNAPAGTVLQSVTFYLYAQSVNPDGAPVGFSLYDGIGADPGDFLRTLNLTDGVEGQFFSFTVSGDELAGGLAITADGLPVNALLNISSELNPDPFQLPGLSATYAPIPEPATALLGSLGVLALFRRNRLK